MNEGLEALAAKRRKWIDANRENGFEEGIKNLLTQIYPYKAHFIYELLQNAEDTHASVVRFTLGALSLDFEHNGPRMFSLADVDSITSIGVSTKRDDPTSIGKFGVGFKAVFAYTNTPEVHSGGYHFRIRDLVVPDAVGHHTLGKQETVFTFPFDHHQTTARRAGLEISQGLTALGENTLLFLRYTQRIEYLMPDGALGTQERIEHGGGHIEIRYSSPGSAEANSDWLRFEKSVKVLDDEGRTKDCRIAIAYRLEADGDNKKKNAGWRIVPLDQGQVSIFFPAENEISNLRFHLHAPFASTVARDSIRECSANDSLRDHLAELVVESLSAIRGQGLLDVRFLAVLPNRQDNIPNFYQPICDAILQAFKDDELTPTKSGSHAPATGLYRGPARIVEVLSDDDLAVLAEDDELRLWAANPPQQNQREDRFLDSLGMGEWGWAEMTGALSWPNDRQESIEEWVAQKNDAWVMRFYALLGEACDAHDETVIANSLRIVRVESEGGDEHVSASQAFFPPGDAATPPRSDVCFVKPTVYNVGRSEAIKRYATSFLQHVGVRPLDDKVVIEKTLALYRGNQPPTVKAHIKHIREFIMYWKRNPNSNAAIFGEIPFLVAGIVHEGKVIIYLPPSSLCIDSPLEETGLADLDGIHGKSQIWSGYTSEISANIQADLVAFLKAIGVMYELRVELREDSYKNPHAQDLQQDYRRSGVKWTYTAINEDYSIADINEYLEAKSIPASRLIWHALIRADRTSATARFRPNQQYPIRATESQLVCQLKDHSWIPDRSGVFRTPEEMTQDALLTDFPYDDRNGLLTAIGFGVDAKKRTEEYRQRNELARSWGFVDAEYMELVQKAVKGRSKEDLARMAGEREFAAREDFPEKPSANPERRQRLAVERRENAPAREKVQRERSIEPGLAGIKAEAKAYLRGAYTNGNGKLICQCCRDPMPFKLPKTNQDYFEAVQFVDKLDKQFYENYLALCPICSAKYQHACQTDTEAIKRHFMELQPDGTSSVEIQVQLAGTMASLRFVAVHALDLHAVIGIRQ